MFAYPCPQCQHVWSVSPAQAGNELFCPNCRIKTAIPKLGELKQLPRFETDLTDGVTTPNVASALDSGASAMFKMLAATAAVTLLCAGFCVIRWFSTPVPSTTAAHIAEVRDRYLLLDTSELIREWEDIIRYELDLQPPFRYHAAEVEKAAWFRNTIVFTSIGSLALAGAIVAATRGRVRSV